jgi:hypothetical protein
MVASTITRVRGSSTVVKEWNPEDIAPSSGCYPIKPYRRNPALKTDLFAGMLRVSASQCACSLVMRCFCLRAGGTKWTAKVRDQVQQQQQQQQQQQMQQQQFK